MDQKQITDIATAVEKGDLTLADAYDVIHDLLAAVALTNVYTAGLDDLYSYLTTEVNECRAYAKDRSNDSQARSEARQELRALADVLSRGRRLNLFPKE